MSHIDLEQGNHQNRRRSFAGSDVSVSLSDGDDVGSCYSYFYSTYDEHSFPCISDEEIDGASDSRRVSSFSDCSVEVEEVETERGVREIKVHLAKLERDCRICHLGLDSDSHESGVPIELGCSCKDDLAAAHRQCAETWFKIKGNKVCEICHSIARNVAGANDVETFEVANEASNATATAAAVSASGTHSDPRNFWRGHKFLNFLLACMVFAFVISWLFHFNVSSS